MNIGTVKDLLNLRYGPSIDNPIIGTISPGVQVEILGPAGSYLWVKTPDGKVGYVAAQYVDVPGAVPVTPVTSTIALTPNNGSVNLRSAPIIVMSPDNRVAVVPANGLMTPLEDDASVEAKVGGKQSDNLWLKVRGPDGTEGFVAAWLVTYAPGSGPATMSVTPPTPTQPTQTPQNTPPATAGTPGPVATGPTGTTPVGYSGAALQPDLHAYIDSLTDSISAPQGYNDFWAQRQTLGIPDAFDISPTQLSANAVGRMPINGFGPNSFSQLYWPQYYSHVCGMHNGLDHIVPLGTPLVALSDGIIVGTQANWPFLGNLQDSSIILWCYLPDSVRDANGKRMLSNVLVAYGHLSNNTIVHRHQEVKAGDVIGLSGYPVGEPNNAHLHLELHMLTGDNALPRPSSRRLLVDYQRPQPYSNQTPFNPLLFFSEKLVKYHVHLGNKIGFGGGPTYPSPDKVSSLGLNWPPLDFFTIANFQYGAPVIWTIKNAAWPNGIYDLPTLNQRIKNNYTPFEAYPADFV